jgi:3'-5' exoribonuclease
MPRLSVSELRAGTALEKAPFLLAELQEATDRNGDAYLKMVLRDRSGDIQARYWRVPPEVTERLSVGSGIAVTGHVTEYRGSAQVNVGAAFPYELDDMVDYMPVARRSEEEMVGELQRLISSIKEPSLRELLRQILGDVTFQKRFFRATAAKTFHHACVGGLLEHTLDVARQVVFVSQRYAEVDRDLAVTAAVLHDVGKVESYALTGDFDLTDEGKLLGHVYMSAALTDQAISHIEGFPKELRLRLLHAILASHGQPEKGSPVIPRTPEAIVLHYADESDAILRGWVDHVNRDAPSGVSWTSWSKMHDGELYVGPRDIEEE